MEAAESKWCEHGFYRVECTWEGHTMTCTYPVLHQPAWANTDGRCGHPESEHVRWAAHGDAPECVSCVSEAFGGSDEDSRHAFTTAERPRSHHTYQGDGRPWPSAYQNTRAILAAIEGNLEEKRA